MFAPFVSGGGWGEGDLKVRKCLCAQASGPPALCLEGRTGRSQRSPGPSLAVPSTHPAGRWSECPGKWGPWTDSGIATSPVALAEIEGRTEGHSPRGRYPAGSARTARKATQVPPRREREFENRSRKGLRLPAAPAHCQPLCGQLSGQLRARPLGTPA